VMIAFIIMTVQLTSIRLFRHALRDARSLIEPRHPYGRVRCIVGPFMKAHMHCVPSLLVTALAVAGCARNPNRGPELTQTTSAEIDLSGSAKSASAAGGRVADVAAEKELRPWPEPMELPGAASSSESTPAYDRPPLHEPMGSTYSDVGMPYPLPDVPVDRGGAGNDAPTTRPPSPTPFFESSFASGPPAPAGTSFPETTFGPPGPASTGFAETTFGRDGGT
jgi:hypothetical protein